MNTNLLIKKLLFFALLMGLGCIMARGNTLRTYKEKRDFAETPEPAGKKIHAKKSKQPIFVIQKHNASHLHYDFRIEMDGVLKSWAVPKGPSLNPKVKHLAVLTEDHPMDYATFEGNIPEGHYGAGEVIVWDNGTFENIKKKNGKSVSLNECFKDGHIELNLSGKKLQGHFALVRMAGKEKDWLLVKMRDKYASARKNPVTQQPESVISGKTIEDLQGSKKKSRQQTKKRKAKKKLPQETIRVGKYAVEVTNQDKLLFDVPDITKGDLVEYYKDIAPVMMPYVKNRAVSMQRFPQGVDEEIFFQKDAGSYFPDWVTRIPIKKRTRGVVNYVVIDKPATLVYLANQAVVPHVWLSKIDALDKPDRMIFDLDPSQSNTFADVQNVAKKIKKLLDDMNLPSFYMLTGSKGAHIVVPLKRLHTFDEVNDFAHALAMYAAHLFPDDITVELPKAKRGNRTFVDWLRNGDTATAVPPYAVRAKKGAPVAMPVTWQELCKKGMISQKYTIKNVQKRINTVGDVWKGMNKQAVSLTRARKILNTMIQNIKK